MEPVAIKRAEALRPGDRVRLIAPASPFNERRFRRGLAKIAGLGFEPVWDRSEFCQTGFLAGEDAARAARLQRALTEPDTRAVWSIRGGYGTARLLGRLDLRRIKHCGKLMIGFSDLTALLLNLTDPGGTVCLHGPVVTQLPRVSPGALRWLSRLMTKPDPLGRVPLGKLKTLVAGRADGYLVGGNLSTLTSLVGTRWLPSLAAAILFLEDVGEQAYRLDRMFNQLRQSGALDNIFGVILGSLAECKPAGSGRWSARGVMERAIAELGVPAVSGASFGHLGRNVAIPMGLLARLDAGKGILQLLEPAVQ